MTGYDVAVIVVTGIGLANCLGFCLAYWLASSGLWVRDEFGRFLMLFMACLGSLFALIVSTRLWGEWPGRRQVAMALYVVYVLATMWPARLLWLAQRNARVRERLLLLAERARSGQNASDHQQRGETG